MTQGLNRRLVLRALTLVPALGTSGLALAGRQIEEPLSDAVRSALSTAVAGAPPPDLVLPTEQHRRDHERWLQHTNQRLTRYKSHPVERQEFLQTLWYEARRAGLSLSLVLGLVQVESAFRKFAVSSAGARGYMQVMPFWSRLIGDGNEGRLFQMQTNLRFGCVILRHYLDSERGDLFMGLGRYNGSRGRRRIRKRYWQHSTSGCTRWIDEPSTEAVVWVRAGRQFLRTRSMRSPACTRITADLKPQTAKPPEGGFITRLQNGQALPAMTC